VIIALITVSSAFGVRAATYSGTGFFISTDGYIATNLHVIEGASRVSVRDSKGNLSDALLVLADRANDLAIIKINGSGFAALPIRNSGEVRKGAEVFAIGFPNASIQGRESKVTTGIVSSISGLGGEPNSFQISVPIQPGNSGGPLVDMTGAAVGLTTAKLSGTAMLQRGGSLPENVNYAVKSNYLLELIYTDSNVGARIVKTQPTKVLPLTRLVELVEPAVVFIIATKDHQSNDLPKKQIGDSCTSTSECSGEALCIVNRCAQTRQMFGQLCKNNLDCDGALICYQDKCSTDIGQLDAPKLKRRGESCKTDSDCARYFWCVSGQCGIP
jgi:hypothetical protein